MTEIPIPKSKSERKRLEALGAIPKPPTDAEVLGLGLLHYQGPKGCRCCGEPWPCSQTRLIDAYRAQGPQLSDALGLLGEVDLWITFPKVPDARAVKDKVRAFLAAVAAGRKEGT